MTEEQRVALRREFAEATTVEERRAVWTKALRSGAYKQGMGKLKKRNEAGVDCYCCLGVIEDLAGTEWTEDPDRDDGTFHTNEEDNVHVPSRATADLVGLCSIQGMTRNLAGVMLITLNDDDRLTLAQIADVLDKGNHYADDE